MKRVARAGLARLGLSLYCLCICVSLGALSSPIYAQTHLGEAVYTRLALAPTQDLGQNLGQGVGQDTQHDLQLRGEQSPTTPPPSESDTKPGAKVSKNLSIKSDAFMNEGYSEMELETGKANLNELDAPMARYGAAVELNYSIKPDARVELELFASNALEINSQRRGGKIKTYDNLLRQEENAYNYGNKVMYSAWVSSIGAAMTILKTHRISLLFKQTQLSSDDAIIAMGMSPDSVVVPGGSHGLGGSSSTPNGSASRTPLNSNLYTLTAQFFLTYSYMF